MGTRRRIELAERDELEAQRQNLAQGGVIAPGGDLSRGADVELELVNPDGQALVVEALVAMVNETSTYFALRDTSPAAMARLGEWVGPPPAPPAAEDTDVDAPLDLDDGDTVEDGGAGALADGTDHGPPRGRARRPSRNVHERLRGLTLPQQLKVARDGELHERTALERMYGKAVWEALLRNPRISHPEVAHLARLGTMPRPLLELMVGNAGWLQSPQVRRALLGNPRLPLDQIDRVLRLVPKSELRMIVAQTVYPHAVRSAAKRMLHLS